MLLCRVCSKVIMNRDPHNLRYGKCGGCRREVMTNGKKEETK